MKIVYDEKPGVKGKELRRFSPGIPFTPVSEIVESPGHPRVYMVCERNGHIYYIDLATGRDHPFNLDTLVVQINCELKYCGIKVE